MEPLASGAMAVLAGQWLRSVELVLDLAAMALSLPLYVELVVILLNAVRSALLPLVLLAIGAVAGLVLMSLRALAAVLLLIFRHL